VTLAPRLRAALLAVGLAGTLAAIWAVESRDESLADARADVGQAAAPAMRPAARADRALSAPAATPEGPPPAVDLARAVRIPRPLAADAFEPRSWAPPPRKLSAVERAAAAPPPPPPPQAPPLPYRYMGMMGDGATTTLFLANGERDMAAKPGDVLDGVWRLELVNEQRALFTYVPLQQSRTLTLGAR
jgi:hypothetical protein